MTFLDMRISNFLDAWLENPCASTHARLVAAMTQKSDGLARAGVPVEHYDDDGSEEGYWVHPQLRKALLDRAAVAA